jgi:hypothetical protein
MVQQHQLPVILADLVFAELSLPVFKRVVSIIRDWVGELEGLGADR